MTHAPMPTPASLNATRLRRLATRFDERGLHQDAGMLRLAADLAQSDDVASVTRASRILRQAKAFLDHLEAGHPDPRTTDTNGATR